MREEITEQIKLIEKTIDLDALLVEGTQSVRHLIAVLEEQVFTESGNKFEPALHLRKDKRNQISEETVKRDGRKTDIYTKRINKALDTIDQLLEEVIEKQTWHEELPKDFPKKTGSLSEIPEKLAQLRALLQSYLDLFQELATDPVEALPLEQKEATSIMKSVESALNEILIGQTQVVREVTIALFANGHVLLDGHPGLGKTELAKVIGTLLGIDYSRIQGTPDMTPADILGTTVNHLVNGKITPEFRPGKIFANMVFVDEVNRMPPKTQSALLEAMAEGQVTNGERRDLPKPFLVIAAQNTKGSVGTFPLPDAQLDRFQFKINMNLPDEGALFEIAGHKKNQNPKALTDALELRATQKTAENVPISSQLTGYIVKILLSTYPESSNVDSVKEYVETGASTRTMQAIIRGAKVNTLLNGTSSVSALDIKAVAHAALRHRITLKLGALAENISVDQVIDDILDNTPIP